MGDLCHRGTLSWDLLLEEEIETLLEFLLRWCDLQCMTLCYSILSVSTYSEGLSNLWHKLSVENKS